MHLLDLIQIVFAVLKFFTAYGAPIFAALFAASESLASMPQYKANSLCQALYNGLKAIKTEREKQSQ